ncbi:hypothetical protein [Streptobacillus canis]|uniref:hypothetical protein n=1 Tax=Streptobacillus canis TaxID=2678686 RepID=UPI0012E32725|nr:hypothetical protein [Streptobacillus canis]
MKRISSVINQNSFVGFNYDKYVNDALISSCSICSIKDENIYIYVNDPNVKIFINQIKTNILIEARKFSEIKEIYVLDDKKGLVNARNMKRKNAKEKVTYDDGIKYEDISTEEKERILKDISEVEASEEIKKHLYDIAEIYFKTGKEIRVICPVCNKEKLDLFGDKCLDCLQRELEYKREEAYFDIKDNPYIEDNSKIYIEARRRIVEEKIDKIFKYLEEKQEKANINDINNLFMEYAMYKAGTKDSEVQFLAADELRKKLYHYYLKKNIVIPVLGGNNG